MTSDSRGRRAGPCCSSRPVPGRERSPRLISWARRGRRRSLRLPIRAARSAPPSARRSTILREGDRQQDRQRRPRGRADRAIQGDGRDQVLYLGRLHADAVRPRHPEGAGAARPDRLLACRRAQADAGGDLAGVHGHRRVFDDLRLPDRHGEERSASWTDFFNVEKFPGRRAMRKNPIDSLEQALLADGVPLDKLYPLDVDRAFKVLDKIKPHIAVWWTGGAQSTQLLQSGEVEMTTGWNARLQAAIDGGAPAKIIWNQGLYSIEGWGLPRAARRPMSRASSSASARTPSSRRPIPTRWPMGRRTSMPTRRSRRARQAAADFAREPEADGHRQRKLVERQPREGDRALQLLAPHLMGSGMSVCDGGSGAAAAETGDRGPREALRRGHGARTQLAQRRGRRVPDLAGAFGLRQDHAAPADLRAGRGQRRRR